MATCANCGQRVPILTGKVGADEREYCKKCFNEVGEKLQARKDDFLAMTKHMVESSLDELDIINKEFIEYSHMFYNSNRKKFGNKFSYQKNIALEKLYKAHLEYAHYDPAEEMPLLFLRPFAGPSFLATNNRLYYHFWRSRSISSQMLKGKVDLASIQVVDVKTGITGAVVNLLFNGTSIGAFSPENKTEARLVRDYLAAVPNYISEKPSPEKAVVAAEPDALTKIERLKALYDQGVVSEEEFESKKKELLKAI
jgi:hypothetical protein